MHLAFCHPFGPTADQPELCLVPERPDQFSFPIRVDSLIETNAAIYRLSPYEGVRVKFNSEGGMIIEPVPPSKMYLTPSQPDRPGFIVKRVKVVKSGLRQYETYFMGEAKEAEWKLWMPHDFQ